MIHIVSSRWEYQSCRRVVNVLKKEWEAPALEVLDVSMTMKGPGHNWPPHHPHPHPTPTPDPGGTDS
ncbi:paeninodin family lasso peptide [Cohnella sp. REN36]|uniref:paeninodin family lasso peptide n=1 Tax=Cohnella sp. REN36 TaxID=2887347 RepID=UPI00351D22F8